MFVLKIVLIFSKIFPRDKEGKAKEQVKKIVKLALDYFSLLSFEQHLLEKTKKKENKFLFKINDFISKTVK